MIMRLSNRIRSTTLLAAVSCSALAALGAGQINATPASSQAPAEAAHGPNHRFSLLDRPARVGDNIGAWGALTADAARGLRQKDARLAIETEVKKVAVVPSADKPCLVTKFRNGAKTVSCGVDADQDSVSVSYGGSIGLVPDVVSEVAFTMSDGTTETGRVRNNLWTSPSEAVRVQYAVDNSARSVDLLPMSALPEGATLTPEGVVMHGTPPAGFKG